MDASSTICYATYSKCFAGSTLESMHEVGPSAGSSVCAALRRRNSHVKEKKLFNALS